MAKSRRNAYYKGITLLYTLSLLVCGGVRIVLVLDYIDPLTGFIELDAALLSAVLHIGLIGAIILLFLLSLLKKPTHDYLIERRHPALSLFMFPLGASIVLFSLRGLRFDSLLQSNTDEKWQMAFRVAIMGLGVLSGLSFFQSGFVGMSRQPKSPWALLALAPSFWQLVVLVSLFNSFNAPVFIQENLLNILFMCFASVFFIGQSRILCGFARKDGRNYAIPAGLATSLCGLVLVVPYFVYAVVYRSVPPYTELSFWQVLYILLTGIYSGSFVRCFCKSIKYV